MATVPLSGTNIYFLREVPFSNDYKHTRWFDTRTEQTNYFLNKPRVHSMVQANFQKIEGKNFVRVNKHIDQLWGTNYMMFQNSDYGNKWFYAFVTRLEYKNRETTNIHFQIDVFQTWCFDMKFRPSYVVREHRPLWQSDGSPVINTLDEGLDYGSEYDTVSVKHFKPFGDILFFVIVSKSAFHSTGAGGTTYENEIEPRYNGIPQGLTYYIHPFRLTGNSPSATVDGQSVGLSDTITMLKGMFTQTYAVNNVVNMYVTDFIGVAPQYDEATDTVNFPSIYFEPAYIADDQNVNVNTIAVKRITNYGIYEEDFGNKYSDFKPVKESKLLMYPYSLTILDDFKGNRTVLKNEYIENPNLVIRVRGSIGSSNKVVYSVKDYLTGNIPDYEDIMSSLEHSLINNNPNDVPVLSDYLSAYLQGNKNTIDNQKDSAIWNGFMNAIGSGIGGVASAKSRNPEGIASSITNVAQGLGNTYYRVQGINAKIKDINNIPPTISKMGSNTAFDYGQGYTGIWIIKKQIKDEYIRKLSDFFNMFGYKTNEVKVPNFHTRRYWNYVQTESCNIIGNFNNEDLQELKNVFDNGITLWHTDNVGDYSLENEVL